MLPLCWCIHIKYIYYHSVNCTSLDDLKYINNFICILLLFQSKNNQLEKLEAAKAA